MNKRIFLVLLLLILGSGVFFRFWNLDSIPPGLFHDEAYNGIDAIKSNESGNYKIFYSENYGREGFYINIISFIFNIFEPSIQSLRLTSAIFGSLTLLCFYFLLKELKFSSIASLLSLFMLSFSFWHVNFSRIAYRGILVPFFLVCTTLFFLKGLKNKNVFYFILAGLFLGVGMHTYIAFRVAPFIYVAVLFVLAKKDKSFLKEQWKNILVFFIIALIISSPLIIYFSNNPHDFSERMSYISVFNHPQLNTAQALLFSFTRHVLGFFIIGDPNQRHAHQENPFLPLSWSILFTIGFIISIKKLKKQKDGSEKNFFASALAQATFWLMILPGIFSALFVPKTLRIIGIIPAIFIFTTLAIEYIVNSKTKFLNKKNKILKTFSNKNIILSVIFLIVIISGFSQINLYFNVWAKSQKTSEAFFKQSSDLGLLIKDTTVKKNNYILFNPDNSSYSFQKAKKTIEFTGYYKIENYNYIFEESIKKINCEDSQILFFNTNNIQLKKIMDLCPKMKSETLKPSQGNYTFLILSSSN